MEEAELLSVEMEEGATASKKLGKAGNGRTGLPTPGFSHMSQSVKFLINPV